ncbi:MAG: T9SS type A sorting domain-containing protein [bacterium]
MKKVLTLFTLLIFAAVMNGQVLLDENFDYAVGDSLTGHGWAAHSGATFNTVKVVEGNLSYNGYPLSGIGNMTSITGGSGSREDININYPSQTSGSVYHSFLINVTAATATGDYFFNVGPDPIATSFRGRVFVKDDGAGNLLFGLAQSSSNVTYTTATYAYNTTYLFVLEYKFVPTALNDDSVKLYINPELGAAAPLADIIYVLTTINADLANVGSAAFRQGAQAYSMKIDGLRVTAGWSDIVPVELTSFNAVSKGNNVNLSWTTATETNNMGFELFRNNQKITFVQGNGTTTERKSYSFVDKNLSLGNYNYQLFQVDYDGTKTLVAKSEVDVNSIPNEFSLSQNYPNPFNPTTTIKFAIPTTSNVKLTIYNTIGKEIAALVNGSMEAGNHSVNWNAGDNSSGMYFFKLEAGNFTATKKMMLIK